MTGRSLSAIWLLLLQIAGWDCGRQQERSAHSGAVEAAGGNAPPLQILSAYGHDERQHCRRHQVSYYLLVCFGMYVILFLTLFIRDAAAAKCGAHSFCFDVLVDDESLSSETTAESADLFSKSIQLDFLTTREECNNL